MSLRTKTLGILIVALVVIIGATYTAADLIVTNAFASLEEDEARQNLDRTEQAFGAELERLNGSVGDWALWDDTYAFVQDTNNEYIDANLYDATLTNLRLDMMVFIDNSGHLAYVQAVDSDGVGIELDDTTINTILASSPLLEFETGEDSTTGILTTPIAPLLVASRPIVKSDGSGPIRGSLVMGRWVDDRLVTEIRALTKLDIVLSPMVAGEAGPAPGEQVIEPIDSNTLSATAVLAGVSGEPALTAEITMARSISSEGRTTLRYLLFSLLIIGAAFAVLMTLLLELTVVRPVARLSAFVSSVGTKLSSRVPAAGQDEIGNLGRSVNAMLDTIERHSIALAQANTQLDHERQIVELLNHSLEDKVADRTRDLETANDELRDRNRQLVSAMKQATTDGLTGLLNHRSFQEFIRTADEQKADAELVVFMADIDHFKSVNDVHGHQLGDEILTGVGDIFRDVLGDECVFRYGGDEFAMVTWLPSEAHAEEMAEEMRRRVEAGFTSPAVTVSIGVALYSDAESPEKLVYHADAAMYAAKAAGKNRVKLWTPGAVAFA